MTCVKLVAIWLLDVTNVEHNRAAMAEKRIGLREVRGLGSNEIVWDSAVPGFEARRQRGPAVAYVLKYRF